MRKIPGYMYIAAAVGVGMLGLGLTSVAIGSRSATRPASEAGLAVPPLERRCPDETTIDEAISRTPYELFLPNDPLASFDTVKRVAWCPYPTVVESFDSGVWITQEQNSLPLPSESFSRMVATNPGLSLGTIQGMPAVFADPKATSGSPTIDGGVQFVNGMVLIGVYGDGSFPLADLVRVANSLNVVPKNAA